MDTAQSPPHAALQTTGWVEVRETHAGTVFLVGERAYKMKKPLDLGFLDFTRVENRVRSCHREIELNRRLSPDVYLGSAEMLGPGREREPFVVMLRMPAARRLSTLVENGYDVSEAIYQLAALLARFHECAERGHHISAAGTRDALYARWQASLDQVRHFRGAVLDPRVFNHIEHHALTFLRGRDALFDSRIAANKLVDGHGDLLADDIFLLDDGPRVLDCLEFDDQLRWVDVIDDIAFLAMDLERLGSPALAGSLLDTYAEISADPSCAALRHHYIAYRAFVRCKVACIRYAQSDDPSAELARQHADLALRHLREGEVRLVLVGGLPGSGKSTLGEQLAGRLDAALLNTDRIRKELAGIDSQDGSSSEFECGIYARTHTERTYREVIDRARALLAQGRSVVLDASWTSRAHRSLAAEAASDTHARLVPLRCWVPPPTAADRLDSRVGSVSDATLEIASRMAAQADPWPDAYTINTDGPVSASLEQALDRCLTA
ncbi:AAA family ATPase [Haloechinothrix sp. YIM 98757]|uniref:AAA family ATPase n=1 Tax=Haloechinothrix aidingensis TaxID=2752311 RepID=A0A838ACE7_9PSEU|nr:bifunctional aminoglycoside phosphotransferase/ATP-binding protein [Haloechinothrix aidingensis]MBA0126897.1 AAA family ATPase [Haloechinothrix aidingensis]